MADDDVEEDRLLLEASASLLMGDGDDFISDDQRAEEAAERRRLERQEKRQRLLAETGNAPVPDLAGAEVESQQPPPVSVPVPAPAPVPVPESQPKQAIRNADVEDDEEENDDDMFDMFSSSVTPPAPQEQRKPNSGLDDRKNNSMMAASKLKRKMDERDHQRDFDDSEGYYKATIGEIIPLVPSDRPAADGNKAVEGNINVRVQGIIGKGVFSSVLKCSVTAAPDYLSSSSTVDMPLQVDQEVAVKCIRSNETMTKSALNEIKFLRRLSNCTGIVQLLLPTSTTTTIDHHGHTILVFPYEPFNLRDVLIKFGKGVGLSLMAVKNFFGQLLAAATHLIRHKILHADIKPDNLLVSESYSQILIADFGSAMDLSDPTNAEIVTPYLASRFYRAPEVILGLPATFAIDLWSLAVTAAEIFLGNVLFQGATNNDMLYKMMSSLGPMSNRMIRRHLLQVQKNPIPAHFTQVQINYFFRRESVGKLKIVKARTNEEFSGTPLFSIPSL